VDRDVNAPVFSPAGVLEASGSRTRRAWPAAPRSAAPVARPTAARCG